MNNKKKILIVIDKLNMGGVTTSLLNLVQAMNKEAEFSIAIFNMKYSIVKNIPKNVTIIHLPKILLLLGMSQKEIRKEGFFLYIFRLILVLISKFTNGIIARKFIFFMIKEYGNYDLAISYTQDVGWNNLTTGCNDFVLRKVKALNKVAYVHCDYKNYGGYHPKVEKTYNKFNKIVCVSKGCKESFINCFPKLSSKTVVCENFTNTNRIIKLSKKAKIYEKDKIIFVTICRLAEEKGIDRTIFILKKLYNEGFKNFKWIIVGGGEKETIYKNIIKNNLLGNYIEFVGERINPYYYLKNADYFLLPSFHEAAPMVFGESIVLKVPIITTNTISAVELVEKKEVGIVCKNSKKGLYDILKKILNGKIKKIYITDQQVHDVNKNAIKDFLQLIK